MNTIRELKQQEKYKSMLKRKNKEKKIYKDKNASLQIEKQRLYIALRNKDKEIERLNNIINELEKWLKYKKEQMEEFELYKRKETGAFWYSTMGNIETFIERIQELKGSDKE